MSRREVLWLHCSVCHIHGTTSMHAIERHNIACAATGERAYPAPVVDEKKPAVTVQLSGVKAIRRRAQDAQIAMEL